MNDLSKITITAIVIASLAVGGVWYVNNDGGDVIDGGASDQGEIREKTIPMIYFGANVDSPPLYERDVVPRTSWSYTPTANISGVSFAISGTATSWLTLSNGVISGTVPNYDTSASPTNTYTLVVTASTTQPTQTATQTITFNVLSSASFQLGDNVTGTLDFITNALSITGTGDMYDFGSSGHADNPMGQYAAHITSIDIGEDVTSIGDNFAGYPEAPVDINYISNVTSLTGGEGITTIGVDGLTNLGHSATSGCSVDWFAFESLETIDNSAFYYANLDNVIIPDSVTTIGTDAFAGVPWYILIIGDGLSSLGTDVFGEMTFYEHDNSTTISGTDIKGDMYRRNDTTSTTCFANTYGSAENSTYSNTYTYLVSGGSVPNTTEDNITFNFGISNESVVAEFVPEYLSLLTSATVVWTLEDVVGTAAIGSSGIGDSTSFTSGTAPTVSSSTTISTNAIATVTVTDGASVTISTDYGLDFHALVAPVLAFTSTPSS